jgi:two-component system, NarL family, invasion response regulator UvrY
MKILIVDDHAVVRRGLRELLADAFSGSMFGEASDFAQALELACGSEWNVAIVDFSLPGRSGLETLTELKKARPNLPVIVFSFNSPASIAVQCIRAGAAAYLSKNDPPEEIARAIRSIVCQKKKYITPDVTECLAAEIAHPEEGEAHRLLSARELSVLLMIASGQRLTRIADDLNLSVKTVSTYRTRILRKMRTQSNADLTRYVVTHSLV